jgi:hypothetical protein
VNRLTTAAFLLAGAAMLQAPPVFAQSPDPPRPRFEAGIGSLWIGQQPLGTRAASETTGAGGSTPLFSTSSDLASAAGIDGRIGVRVTRSLVAEADASYLKPQLRVAIGGDLEGAAAVTATETVHQFTIGGGVLWYLPNRAWTRRFAPFAMAGGGYLRQLHDQGTLVDTGRYYQVGGGVTYLLASRGHFHTKGIGARADVRALIRSKGVAFDGGGHTSPAFGVSAFVRF